VTPKGLISSAARLPIPADVSSREVLFLAVGAAIAPSEENPRAPTGSERHPCHRTQPVGTQHAESGPDARRPAQLEGE